MKYLYSPSSSKQESLSYDFDKEKETVNVVYSNNEMELSDTFDFSILEEGDKVARNENGYLDIETVIPVTPILNAERINGEVIVVLLYFHSEDASEEEKFPSWKVVL